MYGLLLDSIQKFIREHYGEKCWACIRRRAKLMNHWFVTHEVYSDTVILDLVEAAAAELGETQSDIMMKFGEYFVQNIGRYGYARLLRVLGRDMRDFLNGLDDLHEYLRFSYPKMKPPSFYCEDETPEGMLLHYTTCRKGFLNYVIGQLHTVGRIYGKELDIVERSSEVSGEEIRYVLELKFDNSEMLRQAPCNDAEIESQIDSSSFLGVFPFSLIFDDSMTIYCVGSKLKEVFPQLIGLKLDQAFTLKKPQFGQLTWSTVSAYTI